MTSRKLAVEPISFGITGIKVEDLFLKDFVAELRKELPNIVIAHFCIGFADSKDLVAVSHDRRDGKYTLERVDVEGTDVKLTGCVLEVLKRVLG